MATERGDKRVLGMPYDFRKPTVARAKSRMWNSEDRRIFPPKSFGAGWTINAYWLVHPVKRLRLKKK
jgi:hypothetical protein